MFLSMLFCACHFVLSEGKFSDAVLAVPFSKLTDGAKLQEQLPDSSLVAIHG